MNSKRAKQIGLKIARRWTAMGVYESFNHPVWAKFPREDERVVDAVLEFADVFEGHPPRHERCWLDVSGRIVQLRWQPKGQ